MPAGKRFQLCFFYPTSPSRLDRLPREQLPHHPAALPLHLRNSTNGRASTHHRRRACLRLSVCREYRTEKTRSSYMRTRCRQAPWKQPAPYMPLFRRHSTVALTVSCRPGAQRRSSGAVSRTPPGPLTGRGGLRLRLRLAASRTSCARLPGIPFHPAMPARARLRDSRYAGGGDAGRHVARAPVPRGSMAHNARGFECSKSFECMYCSSINNAEKVLPGRVRAATSRRSRVPIGP